jgi:hypothetical protein
MGGGSGSGGATRRCSAVGPGPDSRPVSRPRPCRSVRRRRALFEQGSGGVGSLTRETRPTAGERGTWVRGPTREKKWSGPSPDEQ